MLLGAHIQLYVTAWFFGKNSHWAKLTKIDQKWLKNKVSGLFKKIVSLVLSGNCVKWKFLRFINILRKILVKTWLSSYSKYLLSANEISVFFNCQCFTNRLISDFDFWHVDRHEWKELGSLTGFLKKFSFEQMGHCMPKNCTSSSFWIHWKDFFEVCTMKGANS